ncbi:MAG: hypothetical protein GX112_08260, partial [Clostridiaceae bacterium]|nr:hypothetical protein [Clostridiaceae bacterium]
MNEGWYPHPANDHYSSHENVDFQQPGEQDMKDYFCIMSGYGVKIYS